MKPEGDTAVARAPQPPVLRSPATSDPHADIAWINEILWGVPVETTVGGGGDTRESGTLATFMALPSAKHPHLLVPYESRNAASRALQNYTDARLRIRAGAAILGAGLSAGIPQLFGQRVRVSLAVDRTPDDSVRPPLNQYLADVLGRRDLEIAVRMGGPRPNRKPVLQVLTRSGQILAYAKVGWNDLTRSLVRNEADVLTTFAQNATEPTTFSVPELIHTGTCGDLDVLVIAPVSPMSWLGRTASRTQLVAASLEIGSLTPTSRRELVTSSYWQNTRSRLDALSGVVRDSRFEVLQDLLGLIEQRYGDDEIAFGRCHGDWTCWNVGRRDSKLFVLDWERSTPVVPVGLDAAHYDFDLAVKFHKRAPLETVWQLLNGGGSLLPALAPDPGLARLLLSLDLLEMVLRFEEARLAGLDIVDTIYFGALRSAVFSPPTHS
jgi:hypothetical protein